ncbi:Hypothetical predicted protein [Octopus vulgaris]|uniref:ABC transporter family G domain-containing protein n=1 Tax=Octopus vulgaris TaxID=6645 RepID=A0AA36BYX3_OCTVU|nr:Hypothetical predicted protein [Octopus vulgaris]
MFFEKEYRNGRPREKAHSPECQWRGKTRNISSHNGLQALLRMDKSYDKQQRIQRVKDVIREILTDPPLIFLDEPTSGLDSYLARNLIQVLKNMASRGRTIVSTIHQPSSEIFTMFDELLLMADGRVVFMGPTKDAMLLFRECGLQCPTNYNPADFYLDNLSIIPNQEDDYVARTQVSSEYRNAVSECILAFLGYSHTRPGQSQIPRNPNISTAADYLPSHTKCHRILDGGPLR